MSEASRILQEIGGGVEARQGERVARVFCEDGVYHDVFYGAFAGRAEIRRMVDERFYESAADMRWDFLDPVSEGSLVYARYLFSYRSLLPEAQGARALFEGVAMLRLRDGLVAEYHEILNCGPGLVDMRFAPERIAKIAKRQGDALKARPEMRRHLA